MSRWAKRELCGWGRYPRIEAECARPERRAEAKAALLDRAGGPVLGHGLARSYGDAALLRRGRVILTERLDRMLDFDPETGWLTVEAGVSLLDIIATFVPRGFFPPVVPGTQFVTVGGALANDIHGKNHHAHGTFSDHVRRVELLTGRGQLITCDRDTEPELFWATVGGLGLTGLVLSLQLKLIPIASPLISMDSIRVENLDHFFEVSADSADTTYTVSWVDVVQRGAGLGRGIFMRGEHASADAVPKGGLLNRLQDRVAPLLDVRGLEPEGLVNPFTMRAFNELYFRKQPAGLKHATVGLEPFYFPLDFVKNWNRLYGKRGMLQYQIVVPPESDNRTIRRMLEEVSASGMASFLAVIKEFGDRQHGGLSFPRAGVTLALDFPNLGAPLYALMERLDVLTMDAGGRIYLGKDARLSRDSFRRMYPNWEAWKAVRDRWDPDNVFQSELGRRLGLCGGAA